MEATIFNIQKFCLHDGPGIRSTVFFKGCNLRCKWCANPESQKLAPQYTLDREKCLRCGRCAQLCPGGARTLQNFPIVNESACTTCDTCLQNCPAGAIAREGRRVTLDEVLAEVLKDKPFYDHSGGGVTFSGGEVLLQQDFAVELARRLHEAGVHVAAESAACVPRERFEAFLNAMDYIFVDLKHHDSARHRAGTGLGNEQALENIRILRASGKPFKIRIPVIPGYNDTPEDALAFARLLAEMDIREVQLLPFHQLGERKYSLLGWDYAYAGTNQLHREDMGEIVQIFARMGVNAEV